VNLNTANFNKTFPASKAMTHRQPSSCLETSAFEAMVPQTVLKVPSRSTGAFGHTTQDGLLVDGSIRANLSERGWTL
jgi:hypothetical protein